MSESATSENAVRILDFSSKVPDALPLKNYVIEFIAKNNLSAVSTNNWREVIGTNPELLQALMIASK
jgi:hypothetical protein